MTENVWILSVLKCYTFGLFSIEFKSIRFVIIVCDYNSESVITSFCFNLYPDHYNLMFVCILF